MAPEARDRRPRTIWPARGSCGCRQQGGQLLSHAAHLIVGWALLPA